MAINVNYYVIKARLIPHRQSGGITSKKKFGASMTSEIELTFPL